LIDPKMKPTYPWSRNAEGIPTMVITLRAFRSNRYPSSLVSVEKRARTRWMYFMIPDSSCDQRIMSLR